MWNFCLDNTESTKARWSCDISEYFSLITKHVKKYSFENSIQNSEKTNDDKKNPKKKKIKHPQIQIHWKEFVLNFLFEEYEKGREWTPELYRLIKKESFSTEKNWLSLFFWEEFEMRTKPSCLVKEVNIKKYPQSEYFTYVVEASNKKDLTADFKAFQEKLYSFIRILQVHITSKGHPFKLIISKFIRIFNKCIKKQLVALESLRETHKEQFSTKAKAICDEISVQLFDFINNMADALSLMYSQTINYYIFAEEKDEFVNLISGCVFSNNSLYMNMISLVRMSLSSEIKEFDQVLEDQKFITPEFLTIPHHFCLNHLSLIYYKEKMNGKKDNSIQEFNEPYQNTIELLKSIGKYKKPYDKLLLIHKMSHSISDCINSFWGKVDSNLQLKSFGVDADNLLNIFDYIIIKSQMSELLPQMKFAKLFTSTKTRSTMIGYYFSSLEVCILKINSTKDRLTSSFSSSIFIDSQDMTSEKKDQLIELNKRIPTSLTSSMIKDRPNMSIEKKHEVIDLNKSKFSHN